MNATGKKKLIKSLTPVIQTWLDNADPNSEENTDVGYIGERTVELMAMLAITALELSNEAQSIAVRDGFLSAGT